MSKIKVQVRLTENALKDFKGIQNHENNLVSDWGVNYLIGMRVFSRSAVLFLLTFGERLTMERESKLCLFTLPSSS